jgi:uncharacterized phiE125 gp8 family phage protein
MIHKPVVFTGPSQEPITLEEARSHLQVVADDQDELLELMIAAATRRAQAEQHRTLLTTTFDWSIDAWPCSRKIVIPGPPLQSVTSIAYLDPDGVAQTLAANQYRVITGTPGLVIPAVDVQWPSLLQQPASVTIRYVAGYASHALVPASTKYAILLMVGDNWENREAVITGTIVNIMPATEALLAADQWGGYA